MISIAICDDERAVIAHLASLVQAWASGRGVAARLLEYENAEPLLFALEEPIQIDVLLLDIQMQHMNGVMLARRIRRDDEAMQIIFITGYPDFIAEGYDVSALHYLMKPVQAEKLFEVLDRALLRLEKAPRTILLPKAGGMIKINAEAIVYAEVYSHTVSLHLLNGQEELQMSLSDMEKRLGDGFFKCHRSYIVSMRHVRRVTKTAMLLTDGREIPLARGLYDAANQAFIQYN